MATPKSNPVRCQSVKQVKPSALPPKGDKSGGAVKDSTPGKSTVLSSQDVGTWGESKPKENEILGLSEIQPPTLEEIQAAGFPPPAASKISQALEAAAKVVRDETLKLEISKGQGCRAHFVVTCPRETGYWKIGRWFGKEETIVFVDDLSETQIKEMEQTNPLHLTVERVG